MNNLLLPSMSTTKIVEGVFGETILDVRLTDMSVLSY